jgi:uncharacterized protein (TIGR03083 family)
MSRRLPSGFVNAEMMDERPAMSWYLDHVLADVDRFAAAMDVGPLDTPVGACTGWDLARLTAHLGQIHRWARFCAINARSPDADEAAALESFEPANAADWLRAGARELVETLGALDPEAPTWHPFPAEQVTSFWPRRQAHETAMHRWDAEHAVGATSPIEPKLASDGIDEYLEIVIPRLIVREGITLPPGSVHLHCTDVDGEWLVFADDTGYQLVRAHQKGDAALRGPAEAMLLRLWHRDSGRESELSPVGDESVLDAWLALGGA